MNEEERRRCKKRQEKIGRDEFRRAHELYSPLLHSLSFTIVSMTVCDSSAWISTNFCFFFAVIFALHFFLFCFCLFAFIRHSFKYPMHRRWEWEKAFTCSYAENCRNWIFFNDANVSLIFVLQQKWSHENGTVMQTIDSSAGTIRTPQDQLYGIWCNYAMWVFPRVRTKWSTRHARSGRVKEITVVWCGSCCVCFYCSINCIKWIRCKTQCWATTAITSAASDSDFDRSECNTKVATKTSPNGK